MNALQLPFLIRNYDALEKVFLADFTAELLKGIEKLNLHPLGLMENGFRHFGNNVRPIYKPEDLKGIKLRVAETKMHQEIFKTYGAIPIPISYGEIYTSLKTGVINGTEINATSASSEKLMEVLRYFSKTGHFFWPSVAFVNKGVWDKIPAEDQNYSRPPEGDDSLADRYVSEPGSKAFGVMEKRGIKINDADTDLFFKMSKPIYDQYLKYPVIDKFVKAVQAMP